MEQCDLGRPSCLTCIKSNRACTGYDRSLIFVNRTLSSPSSTAASVLSALKAQRESKSISASPETEADLHYLFLEASRNCHGFRIYAVELLKDTYLPKQSLISNFDAEASQGSFSWVYRLADLTEPSQALDDSLFAFCLAQLHITNTGNASLDQCLDWYNTALQHLRSDLVHPEKQLREETLAAISVLSTFEVCTKRTLMRLRAFRFISGRTQYDRRRGYSLTHLLLPHNLSSMALLTKGFQLFVCPTEVGWRIHARGVAEILRMCDPGVVRTPAWRHLCVRLRVVCVSQIADPSASFSV